MHLPINSRDCAVGINHRRSVVINTRRSSFEQRGDDDDFMLRSERAQSLGGRTGDRFSQFEILVILALTKIARAKKFLEANDLRALFCRRCDSLDGLVEVRGGVLAHAHLNEPKGDLLFIGLACHKSHSLGTKKGEERRFPFLSRGAVRHEITLGAAQKMFWSSPKRLSPKLHDNCRDRRS